MGYTGLESLAEGFCPPDACNPNSKPGSASKATDAPNPDMRAQGTVTRASLTRSVQRATGVPRAQASTYVAEVLAEIFESVVAREDVKLSSFGNFIVREKRERKGRNPKTGAAAAITARLVVVFRPSPLMRARLGVDSDGVDQGASGRR
jgi:integration host factor subunit alpha